MPGHGRRTTSRTSVRLGVITAVAAVLALLPGAAGAAPNRADPPDVVPILDCVLPSTDGTWTAVFGYDNRTGATVTIPVGPANQVTPVQYGTPQPTTFEPGVRHGVFAVTVTRGGGPMWHLGRTDLAAREGDAACPPSTQMPADGNGTGLPIVLAAAGGAAALVLARARRRAVTPGA